MSDHILVIETESGDKYAADVNEVRQEQETTELSGVNSHRRGVDVDTKWIFNVGELCEIEEPAE